MGAAALGIGPRSRGAHRGSAAATLRSPPSPAPHHRSSNKRWRPRLPASPPPGLCSLPAPTPLPGRRATADSSVLRPWARAPPSARPSPLRSLPRRQPQVLPQLLLAALSRLPPTQSLLSSRAEPRARPRSPKPRLFPGPARTSFPAAGTGWSGWAPLLPLPQQKDNGGFVPTASEAQFHV